MNMKKIIFLVMVFYLCFTRVYCGEEHGNYYVFIPYAGYSDETGIMVGSFAKTGFSLNSLQYESELSLNISENKQLSLSLNNLIPLNQTWKLGLELKYRKWPDTFYGFSNSFSEKYKVSFTPVSKVADVLIKYQPEQFFFGINYVLNDYDLLEWDSENYYLIAKYDLRKYSRESGSGIVLGYDNRDNSSFTFDGNLVKAGYYRFFDSRGKYLNQRFFFDGRAFRELSRNSIIAFQFYGEIREGKTNFMSLPRLGNYLRAYPAMKYIEKKMIAFRSEYKLFPFSRKYLDRLGLAVFFESGRIGEDLGNNQWQYSTGTGIRYNISKKSKTYLRADFAIGRGSTNVILIGREAF